MSAREPAKALPDLLRDEGGPGGEYYMLEGEQKLALLEGYSDSVLAILEPRVLLQVKDFSLLRVDSIPKVLLALGVFLLTVKCGCR